MAVKWLRGFSVKDGRMPTL